MRVFHERNGAGYWQISVRGQAPVKPVADDARGRWLKKLAKQRKKAGAVPGFCRRPPQHDGHGLARTKTMGACISTDIEAVIVAQARARGVAKGALLGRLMEIIADENLFDALLDGEFKLKEAPERPTFPRRQAQRESQSFTQVELCPLSQFSTGDRG